MTTRIIAGDSRDVLRTLPEKSIQMCVTSPPYFWARDYGVDGQIGLEATVEEYVSALVDVFGEVRRVLRDDGIVWLNLGSSYAADKQLIPVPWLVGLALQQDGWILRQDIIYSKPNPMPESVRDRCTKSHEYMLLLSKQQHYFYNADAIAEPAVLGDNGSSFTSGKTGARTIRPIGQGARVDDGKRNKRSVWTVATAGYSGAHYAVFPPKLVEPCILAGSREGDTVLDPFAGSGTTGMVADRLGRHSILIDLNPTNVELARCRIEEDAPLFAKVETA